VGTTAGLEVLEKRKICCPAGNRNPDRPVCSLVAIQTTLKICHCRLNLPNFVTLLHTKSHYNSYSFEETPWGTPSFLSDGYRDSFPGVQLSERDVNHSPPSSAEAKAESSYTSTPPTCLHDMEKHNFNFFAFSLYNS
jgi:hypothetical protein